MKVIIKKATEEEKEIIKSWPIWEKEVSKFPWEYAEKETCLIINGEVTVTNEKGENFDLGPNDLVIFPRGMKCKWNIKKAVRKHYHFG